MITVRPSLSQTLPVSSFSLWPTLQRRIHVFCLSLSLSLSFSPSSTPTLTPTTNTHTRLRNVLFLELRRLFEEVKAGVDGEEAL